MAVDWQAKCYETVDWDLLRAPGSPHGLTVLANHRPSFWRRLGRGLWNGTRKVFADEAVVRFFEAGLETAATVAQRTPEDLEAFRGMCAMLFPMDRPADVVVGKRSPGAGAEEVAAPDQAATQEVLKGLGCILDQPYTRFAAKGGLPFQRGSANFAVGGPIPNALARNVLYGPRPPPVRFRLDVAPGLAHRSPDALKAGRLEGEPEWFLCDEDGRPTQHGKPVRAGGRVTVDQFTIVKTRHPDRRSSGASAVVLAGCHGLGTMAAGRLLRSAPDLARLCQQTKGRDFQVVGQVEQPTPHSRPCIDWDVELL